MLFEHMVLQVYLCKHFNKIESVVLGMCHIDYERHSSSDLIHFCGIYHVTIHQV